MNDSAEQPSSARAEEAARRAGPVIQWLVEAAHGAEDPAPFFAAICERIRGAGVPLKRATVHARTIHPQIRGLTLLWRADSGANLRSHRHGAESEPGFTNSPIFWIYGGAERFRRRLGNPDVALDFGILAELKADGFTDYVAERMPFIDGINHAITWATTRPGGFSEEDLAFLDALVPHLGLVFEARILRRTAETLLKVYLGADAGERVLKGQVTRGSGQAIEAAILFADLRGFTELSELLPGHDVIHLLNQYFEAVIAPVEDHGGEVLKLIGDGMLAIFPIRGGGPRPACLAAFAAAKAAFANLAKVNLRRASAGERPARMGITLHLGSVIYGNIGGMSRLDFTVIGPAVNLVGRMQKLCRRFGKGVLLSAAFAAEAGIPVMSLGHHALRGVAEPPEIFALPPSDDPYFEGEASGR